MKLYSNITIIGLGLIGGSLAKAFRTHFPDTNIVGIDINIETGKKALQDKVLNTYYPHPCIKAVREANLIIFCVPVGKILPILEQIHQHLPEDCLLTDVGSTKGIIMKEILQYYPDLHFIGGHPMAGSEQDGYIAAKANLFLNCKYILTPSPTVPIEEINNFKEILQIIGAQPLLMNSDVHDHCTAGISHFPHVAAALLVHSVMDQEYVEDMKNLVASGFKDTTRIAASHPAVWQQITLQNKEQLLYYIQHYKNLLSEFENHLESQDEQWIFDFFDKASQFRKLIK